MLHRTPEHQTKFINGDYVSLQVRKVYGWVGELVSTVVQNSVENDSKIAFTVENDLISDFSHVSNF